MAFSPDGKTLASGSTDKTVRLWEVTTGKNIETLSGHTERIQSVAFSNDGKTLASGSLAEVKLWDVATSTSTAPPWDSKYPYSVVFSPDGKTLASGCGQSIALWNMGEGTSTTVDDQGYRRPHFLSFSADGKTLIEGSRCTSEKVRLWDVSTRKKIVALLGDHAQFVFAVRYAPGSRTLIAIYGSGVMMQGNGEIALWDIATAKTLATYKDPTAYTAATISPDGKTLAVGTSAGDGVSQVTIKLWNLEPFSAAGN